MGRALLRAQSPLLRAQHSQAGLDEGLCLVPGGSGHFWNSWIAQEKRRLCWEGLGAFAPQFRGDESGHSWAREVSTLSQAPKSASASPATAAALGRRLPDGCSMCGTGTRSLGNLTFLGLMGFSLRNGAEDKARKQFKQRHRKRGTAQSCWHPQTAVGRVKGRD